MYFLKVQNQTSSDEKYIWNEHWMGLTADQQKTNELQDNNGHYPRWNIENKDRRKEESISDLRKNNCCSNIYETSPTKDSCGKGRQKLFEELVVENYTNLTKTVNPQI